MMRNDHWADDTRSEILSACNGIVQLLNEKMGDASKLDEHESPLQAR
jgi:hypothetical protein